jgi:hypothetical protein
MRGGVTIVLLKRTCGSVRSITDSANNGSRRRLRLLQWDGAYMMDFLLMLRHRTSARERTERRKVNGKALTCMSTASLLQTHLQVAQK